MKEILYLHTGTSYLAAHFFNTLQSYFTYDDGDPTKNKDDASSDEVKVDHDVSFQEGCNQDGSVTYTPRAILLDYKCKFGSIANIDSSKSPDDEETDTALWTGSVSSFRQEPIPQSSYHKFMEVEQDNKSPPDFTSSISYWSDFSRVYYHPRGLCRLPDPADWERDVGWARGMDRYGELTADNDIQDDVFRLFVEECDLLQGLQLTLDAPFFGSFTTKLLTQWRDEHPKLPILSFCSLSSFDPSHSNVDDTTTGTYVLNDAMTLHDLASLSCQIVPLQHPSTWNKGPWCEDIVANFLEPYHSSAILSAHIESITLPMRLKQVTSERIDMATLISHMNWRNDTPFSAMTGTFSFGNMVSNIKGWEFDFSHPLSLHEEVESLPFAQRAVYRGLNSREQARIREWINEIHHDFREPFHVNTFTDIPYPIPSSYPQFFANQSRVRSIPLYTSLRTTPQTGKLAKAYARFAADVSGRYTGIIEELGIERDIVKDASEDWWKWVGAYGDGENEQDTQDIDEDIDEDE